MPGTLTLKKTKLWQACEISRMHNDSVSYYGDNHSKHHWNFLRVSKWKDISGNEHDRIAFDNEYSYTGWWVSGSNGYLSIIPEKSMSSLTILDSDIKIFPTADHLNNWTPDEYEALSVCDCTYITDFVASSDRVYRSYYITLNNQSNSDIIVSCLKFVKDVYTFDPEGTNPNIAHWRYLYNESSTSDIDSITRSMFHKRSGLYLCVYLPDDVTVPANSQKSIRFNISPDDINSYSGYVKKMNGWYAFEACRLANVFGEDNYYQQDPNNNVLGREETLQWKDVWRYGVSNKTMGSLISDSYAIMAMPCPKYEAYFLGYSNESMSKDVLLLESKYADENNNNHYIRGYIDQRWSYNRSSLEYEVRSAIFSIIPYYYTSFLKNKMGIFVTEDLLVNHQKDQPQTLNSFFVQDDIKSGIEGINSEYITEEDYFLNTYPTFNPDTYYALDGQGQYVLLDSQPSDWASQYNKKYYIKDTYTTGIRYTIDLFNTRYQNGFSASCIQFMKPDIGFQVNADSSHNSYDLYFVPYIYYYLPVPVLIPYGERKRIIIDVKPDSIGVANNA